ncbi:MAG: leucyl aminopeptidase family protein [Simkania sp.]|nr:leucyl aminopeptidase family protein [Simkania sp.]
MIELLTISNVKSRPVVDLFVLPFFQGEKKAEPTSTFPIDEITKLALASGDFYGKEEEELLLYPKSAKEKRILLLGLGEEKNCHLEILRKAGASVAKLCRRKKIETVVFAFSQISFAEGFLLGGYTFDSLKGESAKEKPVVQPKKAWFLSVDKTFSGQLERLKLLIEATNVTRDLVNGNAEDVNSNTLSTMALAFAKEHSGLKTTVLGKSQLEKERMGLMLAVNRAAAKDPALILIEYRGSPNTKELTALVGKGVTYDTGGLNLKPTGSMETMKCDMAGAAAVLGTLKAAAALKMKVNLIGVLAVVENAIGPMSFKPGDVYKSRSGKTVEIGNTDAEGRLILADALTYVQDRFMPTRIIDLATLTGGIVVALGDEFSGLFCNDDALAQNLIVSGETTGERLWRMPLTKGYRDALKSKIADMKNIGGKKASPCTAAAFIQAFIQEIKGKQGKSIPWAHLDVAGTAFLDDPSGYHTTNATGCGVRLMIDFLEKL